MPHLRSACLLKLEQRRTHGVATGARRFEQRRGAGAAAIGLRPACIVIIR